LYWLNFLKIILGIFHHEDQQKIFIEKWIKKGKEATDPFDKIFSLWIALIVAAQRIRMLRGRQFIEDDNDRKKYWIILM
jgi:hypothetical protein